MANQHGDFIWYELLTSDTDAAAGFYAAVIGWQSRRTEASELRLQDLRRSAARMSPASCRSRRTPPAQVCVRDGWATSGCDDVDAAVAEIVQAGGAQHMPPTDIPGVGRFAMVADPQGVVFYVMRGAMEGTSTSFAPTQTGHCHWNELATSDQAAALAFYTGQFGWEKGDAMPMGDMGTTSSSPTTARRSAR